MIRVGSRLILPAAVLLCAAGARAQDADLAEKLFQSGERAYGAKSYKEALDTWNQLVQTAPKSDFAPQALLRMARYELEVNRKPEAALPHLDRLKNEYLKTPWAAEGLLLRGQILASQARKPGDLKDAMAEFNRVLDLFPGHPAGAEAHFQLGAAFRDQGQPGRALFQFVESFRTQPDAPVAPWAMIQAAEMLDLQGDLQGCLRLLERVRLAAPQSPAAAEAGWRMGLRVRHRLEKPALKSQGPWPEGKQKWLKTPILMAQDKDGELLVYQHGLDHAYRLKGAEMVPAGPQLPGVKVLFAGPAGQPWMIVPKTGLQRDENGTPAPLPSAQSPTAAFLDHWGNIWISDAKAPVQVLDAEGAAKPAGPSGASAMAPTPTGAVVALDGPRSLQWLDAAGQAKATVPYGKDLPAPFKEVVALASDSVGHVAALVEGGDFGEGVVLYGPDGAVLRQATFKSLGLSGRFTSLVLDRRGGIILCDRRNDTLIRLF